MLGPVDQCPGPPTNGCQGMNGHPRHLFITGMPDWRWPGSGSGSQARVDEGTWTGRAGQHWDWDWVTGADQVPDASCTSSLYPLGVLGIGTARTKPRPGWDGQTGHHHEKERYLSPPLSEAVHSVGGGGEILLAVATVVDWRAWSGSGSYIHSS